MNNKNQKSVIRQIAQMALLIAVTVVLSEVLSLRTPFVNISFSFIPIFIAAANFKPLKTATITTMADLIGAVLFPQGAFFIGFTITSFISGYLKGVAFYKKELSVKRIIFFSTAISIACSIVLNTLFIYYLYPASSFLTILSTRIVGISINLVVQIIMTIYMVKNENIYKVITKMA